MLKMFITKINKLFQKHGRIAMGVLVVIIIIPFVLYFSATPEDFTSMFSWGGAKSDISMYGSMIPQAKLDQQIKFSKLFMFVQGYGDYLNNSQYDKQFEYMALDNMRLIKEADLYGISVSDQQTADYIKNIHFLQKNGVFDIAIYKNLIAYLGQYGITEGDFVEAINQNLMIENLQTMLTDGLIYSNGAIKNFYNNLNEEYDVKVSYFNEKDYLGNVKVSQDNLQKYFTENSAKYIIPKQSKALIVRFNYINFESEAAKDITDSEINAAYIKEKNQYSSISEAEAKVKIKENLIVAKCKEIAQNKAQQFAVNVAGIIENGNSSTQNDISVFDSYAEKQNLSVYKIEDWITAEAETIPRIGKEPALAPAISNLFMDQPISNAVQGNKASFVALLTGREESKPATFDTVKTKVTEDYKNFEALNLARQAANKAESEITSQIKDKKELDTILSNFKFNENYKFTQSNYYSSLLSIPYGTQILKSATTIKKGTFSPVADVDGGAIIVYVSNITVPTEADFQKNEEAANMQYSNFVKQIAWQNYTSMLTQQSNTLIYSKVK